MTIKSKMWPYMENFVEIEMLKSQGCSRLTCACSRFKAFESGIRVAQKLVSSKVQEDEFFINFSDLLKGPVRDLDRQISNFAIVFVHN